MTRTCLLSLYSTYFILAITPLLANAQDGQTSPPLIANTEISNSQSQENTDLSCENIISQIRLDTTKYAEANLNLSLPWMDVNWLKNQLGRSQTAHIYDYVYVWKNFSMFMGADGSTKKLGTLPNQIQAKTFNDVIKIMGSPKKTYSEKNLFI